jgi:hypothetical protein
MTPLEIAKKLTEPMSRDLLQHYLADTLRVPLEGVALSSWPHAKKPEALLTFAARGAEWDARHGEGGWSLRGAASVVEAPEWETGAQLWALLKPAAEKLYQQCLSVADELDAAMRGLKESGLVGVNNVSVDVMRALHEASRE